MSFTQDQITIGRDIIDVAKSLGLAPADTQDAELIGIMAGLDESGLRNIDYGDYPASMGGQMSSSRGVFQQISAWGPESVREDPVQAAKLFYTGGQAGQRGLLDVPGWDTMNPWQAAQAVQQSEFSDGSNYKAQLDTAQQFIAQYGDSSATVPGVSNVPAASGSAGGAADATTVSNPITSVWNGLVQGIETFVFRGAFVVTGLGLVILGVWRMSGPARSRAASLAPMA